MCFSKKGKSHRKFDPICSINIKQTKNQSSIVDALLAGSLFYFAMGMVTVFLWFFLLVSFCCIIPLGYPIFPSTFFLFFFFLFFSFFHFIQWWIFLFTVAVQNIYNIYLLLPLFFKFFLFTGLFFFFGI